MNLWKAICGFFGSAPPPASLRNKAGGMAWILLPHDEGNGTYDLHRRVVQTVALEGAGYWRINPPQEFLARGMVFGANNAVAWPGCHVVVPAIHDDLLEPIRDAGDEEKDESSAWLPPVPQVTKTRQGETA